MARKYINIAGGTGHGVKPQQDLKMPDRLRGRYAATLQSGCQSWPVRDQLTRRFSPFSIRTREDQDLSLFAGILHKADRRK